MNDYPFLEPHFVISIPQVLRNALRRFPKNLSFTTIAISGSTTNIKGTP